LSNKVIGAIHHTLELSLRFDLVDKFQRFFNHDFTGPFGEFCRTGRLISSFVVSGAVANVSDGVVAHRHNEKIL